MIRKNPRTGSPGAWRGYTMAQLDPADGDMTDGAVFQVRVTPRQLPDGGGAGDYNYYFVASDGNRTQIFPNRPARFTDTVTGNAWNEPNAGFRF